MRKVLRVLTAALFILWDAAAVVASLVLAFGLYFGFDCNYPSGYLIERFEYIPFCIAVAVICNAMTGCYGSVWRHAGVREFVRQVAGIALNTAVLLLFNMKKQILAKYELVVIIVILELLLMLLGRVAVLFGSWASTRIAALRRRKNMLGVIVFGAGEAGVSLVHKLETHPDENRRVVGFIDDDTAMWGRKVAGILVLGGRDKLADAIRSRGADEVIVAIPTADRKTLQEVLACCRRLRCSLKRFGTIDDVSMESLSRARISDVNLEDLLRRDSVKLDMEAVLGFLQDKTVLVTGGAGSIGSEICRQVLGCGIRKLVIYDFSENGLYAINNELKARSQSGSYDLVLGSIRDKSRLAKVFARYRPQVVFHAAAHKHVPMMERNPLEAVKNNVFGTVNVARAAMESGAEKFILISTDKAVNPSNIMGASKRIAEMVIQSFEHHGATEFAAVRFGNVLGSSGSVVPFFKKQIAAGGPVTVTHPKMRRYFMTIPEAVQLVLEAGAMARGGEIFVLDMGEPVYITDLARDLIRLSGLEPEKDIAIVYTGLRPGEKLFEEISFADEDVTKTRNNKIYIMKPVHFDEERLRQVLGSLQARIAADDENGMFGLVRVLVPTFSGRSHPAPQPRAEDASGAENNGQGPEKAGEL